MKLLIDECLSPELATLAIGAGYDGSSHVCWIGKAGWQDWNLMPVILEGDWTFVTKNSVDFRGPPVSPGTSGQYVKTNLHAGLICLNGPVGMDLDLQLTLFEAALRELTREPDLVNQVLDVTLANDPDTDVVMQRYQLPSDETFVSSVVKNT